MLENGGQYRAAYAGGKRSACGIALSAQATLCGIRRMDDDGSPSLEVTSDVWLATRDRDVVPDDYRPCPDCCAAYKTLPTGKSGPSLTERLPEPMDKWGATPRDAERQERFRARLGRVVPLLEVDDDGTLTDECLWSLHSKTVHAGAMLLGRVHLVCRDEIVPSGDACHPKDEGLSCSACRKILYRDGAVTVRMWGVINRPHDANRFRPVGGIGEDSDDPMTRPTHDGLLRDETQRGSTMLPGAAGVDMPRVSRAFRKAETGKRSFALRGWAAEAMGGVVRSSDGTLWCPKGSQCGHGASGFHSGWEYAHATGKIPPTIYAHLTRGERIAVKRGMGFVRRKEAAERETLRERERRGTAACAVASYHHASRHGKHRETSYAPDGVGTYVPGLGRIDKKPTRRG